jgi:Putative restriction endonuclease
MQVRLPLETLNKQDRVLGGISQKIALTGISWEQIKLIQSGIVDASGTRLFYHRGVLEILSTSLDRELIKGLLGAILEFFFLEKDIEFSIAGNCSQEQPKLVSLQADESYCFGELKSIPDLSIEIIFSSGNGKLDKYLTLGTNEVWLWEDGTLNIYCLQEEKYQKLSRSHFLPDLDIQLLQKCLLISSHLEALKEFRQGIRLNHG